MSDIALYKLLKRIPDATAEEVEKAVADVASSKEVATKADLAKLEGFMKEAIAKLEARLTWRLIIAISVAVGIIKYL